MERVEIEEGVRKAVEMYGAAVVLDLRLVGVLADMRVFESREYNRELLKLLYRDGSLRQYMYAEEKDERNGIMRRFAARFALNEGKVWPLMELLYAAYKGIAYDGGSVLESHSTEASPSSGNTEKEHSRRIAPSLPDRSDVPEGLLNVLRNEAFVFKKIGSGGIKYGIVNGAGEILHDATYDEISQWDDGYCTSRKGKLWGFIDTRSSFYIPPKYVEVIGYSEDRFVVRTKGKEGNFGIVDLDGRLIFLPQYDDVSTFSQGRAEVTTKDNDRGYIDKDGREVIPAVYEDVGRFGDSGLALVADEDHCLVIDRDGGVRKRMERRYCGSHSEIFEDGYMILQTRIWNGNKNGVLDANGKEMIPFEYSWIRRDWKRPELWKVYKDNYSKEGIVTAEGKTIVEPKYKYVSLHPADDIAIVSKDDKYGARSFARDKKHFFDKGFDWIIPCKYECLSFCGEKNFIAGLNGKQGVIDRNGNWVVLCIYDELRYRDGHGMVVKKDGMWGVIGMDGSHIVRPEFEYMDIASKDGMDLWVGYRSNKLYVYDMSGTYVWGCDMPDVVNDAAHHWLYRV